EDGQHVELGQQLHVGAIDPKEVLRVRGVRAVQQHLVDGVQGVYRSQGVPIHDKYNELNRSALTEGKKTASARQEVMGITKASLATESWLSAASFQETTRVLT